MAGVLGSSPVAEQSRGRSSTIPRDIEVQLGRGLGDPYQKPWRPGQALWPAHWAATRDAHTCVRVLAAWLPIQLPATGQRKTAQVPESHVQTWMGYLAPGFNLIQCATVTTRRWAKPLSFKHCSHCDHLVVSQQIKDSFFLIVPLPFKYVNQ